ncbi:MFS transporter [Cohnella luojiensis]|uniref:MFS transporter n=1 Tax=Cohnella luojiensis TaxID=652876 RepID=A0A4Y8LTA4_9BACL|nr:MFS transporter [Cohnella luojiensis]TFE22676.1 MFS transporter [Cohnella luojiensis]
MSTHIQEARQSKSAENRASHFWIIWRAAWMVTAVFILSNSATPLYVQWQREFGFSNGTLTLVFAAYIAGLLATLLIAGQLSDRFGRKPVLFPGLTAAILACFLFATASSVAALLIARFLTGIAVGVIVSAGMASVVDVGGHHRKQQASLAASVAMVLGAGLGPLLAGVLAQTLSRPVVPIFAIEFVILVSAFFVAGNLPKRDINLNLQKSGYLHMPSVPRANRLHLLLGISVFAPGITTTSFILSLGPSLLSKLLNVTSPLIAGGTACVMFLIATGIQFAVKKLPIRTIFMIGSLATILSMLCTVAAVNASVAILLVLAAVFAGAGQGLGQLGGLTLISLQVPANRRAEANAVLNIGAYIPAAILPVCTGYLIDLTGLAIGATAFATILTVAAMVAVFFVRTRLPRE